MSCSRASYKGDHNFYCELGGDCLMFSPEWSLCKKNDKGLAEMEYKQATYSCDCGQYICHEDGSICPYSTPDPDCCSPSLITFNHMQDLEQKIQQRRIY